MKNILSITAVSIISSALLVLNASATDECNNSFASFAERVNCTGSCKNTQQNTRVSINDNVLQELLKDCEVIYKDFCEVLPNQPSLPDEDGESQSPLPDNEDTKPNKPIVPENKPENDNNTQNNGQNENHSEFAIEILELVNKERKVNGLSPVTSNDSSLNSAAYTRASEQASSFSHTRPNGNNWTTVLEEYGINYSSAGENVAYGQQTAEEVMTSWMNSPGHRANILNASYKKIGIGVYYKNGTYYWAQLFIG